MHRSWFFYDILLQSVAIFNILREITDFSPAQFAYMSYGMFAFSGLSTSCADVAFSSVMTVRQSKLYERKSFVFSPSFF